MQKKTILQSNWLHIVIATVILAFLTNRFFFFKPGVLENLSSRITYPALAISSKLSSSIKKRFRKKQTLKAFSRKLDLLEKENEKLLKENITLKSTLNHQARTSELESFQKRYNLDGIFTKVLVKNIDKNEHYFLINKGLNDGVKEDMVFIYKLQLVGRVSSVFSNHSKVTLITDAKSKIAAYTNENNGQGILLGKNEINSCKLVYVNHLTNVEKGDFVLSSGEGLVFPEGFCLGKIEAYTTKDFYHIIDVTPLSSLAELEFGILLNRSQIINF